MKKDSLRLQPSASTKSLGVRFAEGGCKVDSRSYGGDDAGEGGGDDGEGKGAWVDVETGEEGVSRVRMDKAVVVSEEDDGVWWWRREGEGERERLKDGMD